ncbi:uncharacterized protein TNCV_4845911 [Trichonephila clavipes]|uniref:Uncharacterized protein n=1 Tax=Trichonephila clavipes TaxID=2585209 RepID=A0A8X6WJM5_TRICX|nr:uncharacterized protein TNCV_4845911 [Trichonephila clavipes]
MRGTLKGQRYVDDILRPHVGLFLNGLPGVEDMLVRIQQELLKTSYVIFTLPWAARSPDLYPVEKVWDQKRTPCVAKTIIVLSQTKDVAAVAEWYGYRTVACLVTSSSPVPLKIRRVGQRCTLNLSRAETSSRWCGVVVRRGGASSGVVHVT